jgi:hypothetical protein
MNSSYGIRNRNFHVVLPYIYCDFLVTRRRAAAIPWAGPAARLRLRRLLRMLPAPLQCSHQQRR